MKHRILYAVEDANYTADRVAICNLTWDKEDAVLDAQCRSGRYGWKDNEDEFGNEFGDEFSTIFNYGGGAGTAIISTLKFDLTDEGRFPVGTNWQTYRHTDESKKVPSKISIDSQIERDTSKTELRKFLESNGIKLSKTTVDPAKLKKIDMVMAIIDLMKFEPVGNILEKLNVAQNKSNEAFDRTIFLSKTIRTTAKCILTEEKFIAGELRVGFNVINFREPDKMMTKWCKFDEFFNLPSYKLHDLVKKKKLSKENINVIVPSAIENLMFDDKPALDSLSQSEIDRVKQALIIYQNLGENSSKTGSVDIKRPLENDENENENVSKKLRL